MVKQREADDRPFGGGAGMVLKPEPIFKAVEEISEQNTKVIFATPDGEPFSSVLQNNLLANPTSFLFVDIMKVSTRGFAITL